MSQHCIGCGHVEPGDGLRCGLCDPRDTLPAWYRPSKYARGQEHHVRAGRHPMGEPLATEGHAGHGHRCGDCARHEVHASANRYHKCSLRKTRGPGTDIRIRWPACASWLPTCASCQHPPHVGACLQPTSPHSRCQCEEAHVG